MIILVIGGSASGKSAYAEARMMEWTHRTYLATMQPFGEEGARTILRHRMLREGKGFATIECGSGLQQIEVFPEQAILLEDLPNLLANELFEQEEGVYENVCGQLQHLMQAAHLLVVSGDVFGGGMAYDADTQAYCRLLGALHQWLAAQADEVVEVIHGIPVRRK